MQDSAIEEGNQENPFTGPSQEEIDDDDDDDDYPDDDGRFDAWA